MKALCVGQVYGERNRAEGRPDRRVRVLRVEAITSLVEVIGRLDKDETCSCKGRPHGYRDSTHWSSCPQWGVGARLRVNVPNSLLGNSNHPLLEDVS